jgi:hypothetical protein
LRNPDSSGFFFAEKTFLKIFLEIEKICLHLPTQNTTTIKKQSKMETLIVKANGNESIKANLKFRILTNGKKHDMFIHETYLAAKTRLETLAKIFKYSTHEILVVE